MGGVAAAVCCLSVSSQAQITGSLWESSNSGLVDDPAHHITDQVPANAPSATPDVTFSVPNGSVDFDSRVPASGGYTIAGFLGSNPGGATIINGASEGPNTMDQVLIQLTGFVTVTSGQNFTVEHDDGLTLTIGSTSVIDVPGATAPTSTSVTYSGPSGTFAFNLLYAEVDGAPAVLDVQLPFQPVPEPTTMIAGALLLLPFGASTLRKLRNRAA